MKTIISWMTVAFLLVPHQALAAIGCTLSNPAQDLKYLFPEMTSFKEELQEVTYSIGVEYWYRKQFAIRSGYFHESQNKGNRKFFTVGLGLRLNVFGLDFSYLVPTSTNNPLANTLRFTLSFDFASATNNKTNNPNTNTGG